MIPWTITVELMILYLTYTRKKAIDDDYKVGALFVHFKKTSGTV